MDGDAEDIDPGDDAVTERAVTFIHVSSKGNGDNDDTTPLPETPPKERRVNASSPDKSRASHSPAKHSSADLTAAFRAALRGSPAKWPAAQASVSPSAGPSTTRRPRYTKTGDFSTVMQANTKSSPSRSQGATTPTRPLVRRRFRPIFLETEQWCARDLKAGQVWATAETVLEDMVALHGHPFQRFVQRGGRWPAQRNTGGYTSLDGSRLGIGSGTCMGW